MNVLDFFLKKRISLAKIKLKDHIKASKRTRTVYDPNLETWVNKEYLTKDIYRIFAEIEGTDHTITVNKELFDSVKVSSEVKLRYRPCIISKAINGNSLSLA